MECTIKMWIHLMGPHTCVTNINIWLHSNIFHSIINAKKLRICNTHILCIAHKRTCSISFSSSFMHNLKGISNPQMALFFMGIKNTINLKECGLHFLKNGRTATSTAQHILLILHICYKFGRISSWYNHLQEIYFLNVNALTKVFCCFKNFRGQCEYREKDLHEVKETTSQRIKHV